MKKQLAVLAVFGIAALGVLTVSPVASAAPPTVTNQTPLSGTANGGTLTGTLSNIQFVNLGQGLSLTGVLNGTFTSAAGMVTNIVDQVVTIPVAGAGTAARPFFCR